MGRVPYSQTPRRENRETPKPPCSSGFPHPIHPPLPTPLPHVSPETGWLFRIFPRNIQPPILPSTPPPPPPHRHFSPETGGHPNPFRFFTGPPAAFPWTARRPRHALAHGIHRLMPGAGLGWMRQVGWTPKALESPSEPEKWLVTTQKKEERGHDQPLLLPKRKISVMASHFSIRRRV